MFSTVPVDNSVNKLLRTHSGPVFMGPLTKRAFFVQLHFFEKNPYFSTQKPHQCWITADPVRQEAK
jgi:hypothetical protein